MDQQLWEKCVAFHGHQCPGLAIGFRACEAAIEKLGLEFSADEEIVCVTENDACGVDAIQVITGCTLGKGNLLYHGTGKMAFNFYNRKTGESLRVIAKPNAGNMDRTQRQAFILTAPIDEVFSFGKPRYGVPEKARLFSTVVCEICGEEAPEHKIRLQDGKKVCLDCFRDYSRGW
ncbi:MAG: formylmethanofuran dehydrogenase subunit [Clostridiales bacterium]|nr:formylmethanofuran dehydrogenase subunit [Clostridiales bacterium]